MPDGRPPRGLIDTSCLRLIANGKMRMLLLASEQRKLLAETVRDIANIAAGAMVFGQLLSTQPFCRGGEPVNQNMWNVFILLGGIVVFVSAIGFLDWLGRRKHRQSRNRAA